MNIVVIGGAGFIGCNVADYYLKNKHNVTVFDNFSRKGTLQNLDWLVKRYKENLTVTQGDVRLDFAKLKSVVSKADIVFHFAAQVAVTTSVVDPREDFEINALGTFNVLEAIRQSGNKPIVLYSSTNKVYGGMEHVKIVERNGEYDNESLPLGVSEAEQLDFHSPYGCSKGTADQYMIDYSRIYGIRTVVFRQSCIYGYRQFGVEDQGWVAHFTISSMFDRPLTIYGDGKQVRDVLFIDDLVRAYDMAIKNINVTAGKAYNIGGGPNKKMSLLNLISYLEKFFGKKLTYTFSTWRPGDQRVFICDIRKAKNEFGWEPKIGVEEGVRLLAAWVKENKEEFRSIYF
jgi:CDP-paratose 2-epimerase